MKKMTVKATNSAFFDGRGKRMGRLPHMPGQPTSITCAQRHKSEELNAQVAYMSKDMARAIVIPEP